MVLKRNNVVIRGEGSRAMMFAHGFGCDQHMWTDVAKGFEPDFKTILFDHVGAGASDTTAYSSSKYCNLSGYSDDVIEIGDALQLENAIFVGHSVSAMIGGLASIARPNMFSELVMVGPSPRYINDGEYIGGFTAEQIEELLEFLAENPLGWAGAMGPAIVGNPERPALGERLTQSICAADPTIARDFARVTFFSDNRTDLPNISARSLVLQTTDDIIAPIAVGQYVHQHLPNSEYVLLNATGHCPHLSAPQKVIEAIRTFV